MDAAEYLRKSRMEEGLDTEEVLAKHRKALAGYAAAHGIHITGTYCEVVSGESLYARPEMLRLLEDVEGGKYEAVLVMDLDRLSRGRMKDQGIILDAFRESGTLIITPEKTYDLSDEIDDELAEFKTFMSRREYKIINKRLRRGLAQTIRDGCYVANAPYGYRRVTVERRPTLEVCEPEAQYVRMMFEMYAQGLGCVSIARHVTALGARPHRSEAFTRNSVAKILSNPTYTGKIVWDQKKHIRKASNGQVRHITVYQPKENWTVVDGLHPAIVDQALFDRVQDIMAGRYAPAHNDGTVKSPLAGLVRCARCGRNMQRMGTNKGQAYLLCNTAGCCAGAKFEFVEDRVLQHLRRTLAGLTVARPEALARDTRVLETSLQAVRKELTAAGGQMNRLYELMETGAYDLPTFRTRMGKVKEKRAALEAKEAELRRDIEKARAVVDPTSPAQQIKTVLDAYEGADAAGRNALLKSVVNVIWYRKDKKSRPAEFSLEIDLKPF